MHSGTCEFLGTCDLVWNCVGCDVWEVFKLFLPSCSAFPCVSSPFLFLPPTISPLATPPSPLSRPGAPANDQSAIQAHI